MPPVVIAGGIAAAGAIGGSLLANSAQKKANNQAAQTQNNATNAQLQLGRESMGLNREIYDKNTALLNPYVQRGNVAGDSINALLGLPSTPSGGGTTGGSPAPAPAPQPPSVSPASPMPGAIPAQPGQQNAMASPQGAITGPAMNALSGTTAAAPPSPGGAPMPATAATPASNATDAFNNFANSAGMQFQLNQGADMINNRYAALGALQSGAAMKALQNYGQQTALNNYFMPYMGLLGGQQSTGAQAGAAVAGVGSNFGNTAANINAGMGQAINSGAQNIGNLQLANGQNRANMYGQIGSALGQFGSSFMPTPHY